MSPQLLSMYENMNKNAYKALLDNASEKKILTPEEMKRVKADFRNTQVLLKKKHL